MIKSIYALITGAAIIGATFSGPQALACTGGALTAKDGGVVVGRTLEFGTSLNSQLAVWPKGSSFTGTTETGNNGLSYTSQYGFIGATVDTSYDMIVDGLNEKGLNAALFYFPGYAEYAEVTPENTAKGLSPSQVVTWLLANFDSVDAVKEHIDEIAVLPVKLDLLGAVPDVHYKVQDASGQAITIEPVGGQLKVYDNPVRVLTNAPGFEWHLTNLNSYVNLTADYPKSETIGDLELQPFGVGAGALGLPGDFTPPSRFVRMVFFTQNVPEQPNTDAAVSTLFHLLNNFDIPFGSNASPPGTAETEPEITTWTAVSDLQKLHYHWKTYGHQSVLVVDLHEALKQAGGKLLTREMGPQDASSVSRSTPVGMK
ncbi:MAG: choloylglycine hydrolase family protein [Chromatiaceae bacterium]|nr:choloylglycine hydrolase family protein [Chromatiaceae bacterium]